MKIITFALWGDSPKYLIGAKLNAEQARIIYPDWKCRYYVAPDVPSESLEVVESFPNTEIVEVDAPSDWTFSYNRFLPMSEDGVEALISRDTDSRIAAREGSAVKEWLDSYYSFHIMRDHPWHHSYPILAGMFGCKGGVIEDVQGKIEDYNKIDTYHSDQDFLRDVIHPIVSDQAMIHDDWLGRPFPVKRWGLNFVGQVFDEKNVSVPEHVAVLERFLEERDQ